jgi:hypothetical protein
MFLAADYSHFSHKLNPPVNLYLRKKYLRA